MLGEVCEKSFHAGAVRIFQASDCVYVPCIETLERAHCAVQKPHVLPSFAEFVLLLEVHSATGLSCFVSALSSGEGLSRVMPATCLGEAELVN